MSRAWSGLDPIGLDAELRTKMRSSVVRLGSAALAERRNGYALRPDQTGVATDLARFLERASLSQERVDRFGRIVLPPRTGKTVIAARLVEATRLHSLVLVPTRTLVRQTVREMRSRAPGVAVGAYFGEEKSLVQNGVNVATYAIVQRAWAEGVLPLAIRTAAIVFADEGHHAMTVRRTRVLERAFLPTAARVALTATPDYDGGRTLCRYFPTLIHELTLEDAMDLGLLAPLRVWVAEVDADASTVRMIAGDYDAEALGAVMSSAPFLAAARAFRYGGTNRAIPALIVCSGRQQAKDLRRYLVARRPTGAPEPALILGETPSNERDRILAGFERGELDTIVQVGVLIEGWDAPRCKLLIDLAPSLSRVRATQKYFRVMTKLEASQARIFSVVPARLGFVPILPMELFGRSIDDYEWGELIAPASEDNVPRPLVDRPFERVAGVRLARRFLLKERLSKPRLDRRRRRDVRQVLLSCAEFDVAALPSVSTFQTLFFDHPLFLGRGSSLLRWLRVAPTRAAYATLMGRLYPERWATQRLVGPTTGDWSTHRDARHLLRGIAEQRAMSSDLDAGWCALTGGGEAPSSPEETTLAGERDARVRGLLAVLKRRDREIIEVRFGLVDGRERTLVELADCFDVSHGRMAQLVRRALFRLARRAAGSAREAGTTPTSSWGRRPSSAAGLLATLVHPGSSAYAHFAALAGASDAAIAELKAKREESRSRRGCPL